MALAQELMDPSGGTSGAYHLAMARVQLQKEQFKDAEESIQEALQHSYQVRVHVARCSNYDGKWYAFTGCSIEKQVICEGELTKVFFSSTMLKSLVEVIVA